ncbi:universal stress protein [Kaarinaea lacus]
MKKVVLAVDNCKGSEIAANTLIDLLSAGKPSVTLVHVQKILGQSIVGEGLTSGPELEMLKESIEGTEYNEALNAQAEKIVSHYKEKLEKAGITDVNSVIKKGHPAEEILDCAQEENAELIVLGSRGRRTHDYLIGSVSREVANGSTVPVLLTK